MDRILRFLLVCSLSGWSGYALVGTTRGAEAEVPLRLVASGTLERSVDPADAPFTLADEAGKTTYRIAPAGSINLAAYLGQRVEVVGTLHPAAAGGGREIRAQRVRPVDRIVPAHFLQVSRYEATAASAESAPESDLTPIPESAPRAAPQDQPAPAPSDIPDLPPLMEGPLINPSPWYGEAPPLGEDPLTGGDHSLLLQPPIDTLPPEFDAYQDPAGLDPTCGPQHWIWINGELLSWWTKGSEVPPLATTSPIGTPQADAGVLGVDGTRVLFGNSELGDGQRDGWRWVLGGWLGSQRRLGLQLDYIGLDDDYSSFQAASNGLEIVARPFFNVDPALGPDQGPDAELISYPNLIAGSLQIDASSQFNSLGIHLRGNMLCKNGCFYGRGRSCSGDCSGHRLDLLGGYRYIQLEDQLTIRQLAAVSVTPQAGFEVVDSFHTDNDFQGGELGLLYEWYRNRWSFDGVAKLALGRSRQKVVIDGSTELSTAELVSPFEGGLLALSTNIGSYSRKQTDVVPELGLTVGYLLTSTLRVNCGYRVIYWPQVARVGDQIDTTVNGSYIPDPTITPSGPARPEFVFQEASYWVQGFSLGVDYRW